MMGRTHALIGAIAVSSLVGPFLGHESSAPVLFPSLLLCGVLGALLPDLDSPRSLITSWKVGPIAPFRPVARIISRTLSHRGPLHSLLGWVAASLWFIAGSFYFTAEPFAGLALSLGYFSHLAADACTKTGIPLLYPRRGRKHFLPRPIRLSTGSLAEEIVFAILSSLFLAYVITFHLWP